MMIKFDMVYVAYFSDFPSNGSRESFEQNILFRLSPQRNAPQQPRESLQAGRPAWAFRSAAWPPRESYQTRPEKIALVA